MKLKTPIRFDFSKPSRSAQEAQIEDFVRVCKANMPQVQKGFTAHAAAIRTMFDQFETAANSLQAQVGENEISASILEAVKTARHSNMPFEAMQEAIDALADAAGRL